MRIANLLAAIDAIYDTVGAGERWPAALDAIARVFDAKGAVLLMRKTDGSLTSVVSPALAAAQDEYNREWWRHDFLSHRAIEKGYIVPGNVLTDFDLASPDEIDTHPFCTDFRARHGLGGCLAGSISPSEVVTAYVSVQLHRGATASTDADREALDSLLKHCERALLLSCRLDEQQISSATLQETLSHLGCAVMLLDAEGRISQANAAGRALMQTDLPLISGRLVLSTTSSGALAEAITWCLNCSSEDRLTCTRPILIPRQDRRPLVAYVLPMRSRTAAAIWSPLQNMAAMLVVIDLDRVADIDPALVRDYFGLTLGEARIAAQVGRGRSPREAAQALGISEETVRTTLKRIFSKTGLSRQSELSAILGRMGLLPIEDGTLNGKAVSRRPAP